MTTLQGRDPHTVTARLCPRHFRDLVAVAAARLKLVDEDSQSSSTCEVCGEARIVTIFVRAFPTKEDERQYCADLCGDCAMSVGAELSGPTWRPMPDR